MLIPCDSGAFGQLRGPCWLPYRNTSAGIFFRSGIASLSDYVFLDTLFPEISYVCPDLAVLNYLTVIGRYPPTLNKYLE